MRKEYLGEMRDGSRVFIDLDTSHAVTHFAHEPKLRAAVERLVATLEGDADWIRVDRDMGEAIVGMTDLVETAEGDEIVYAKRPRRAGYSRFVKGKSRSATSWVTIALRKAGEKEYSLYTAFVGRNTPSFPGGDYLPEQSKAFWAHHALVWGSQEVVPGSETAVCPW